jgi:hypothetical protein
MYKKIRLTSDDLRGMISEAVKRLGVIAEENVWDDSNSIWDEGSENLTMSRDMKLEYGICGGEISYHNAHISPCEGADYRDMEKVQELLQAEMELRKEHLQNSLNAFARKMNNLDPEMNITIGEFKPFPYKAEVVLVMPLPTTKMHDSRMGYDYNEFAKPSTDTIEWLQEQGFGPTKRGQWLCNFKRVPGCPDARYRVGDVDATGYTCHVTFSKGGFKLGGYKFVGVVQPYTNADQEDTDALYSDVKLTDEFNRDLTMRDYLKKISAKIKCDGCGKKTSRSFYYIFMDKSNKLFFYGRNCATKIFGIDVLEKLSNYMAGLNKLGEDFANPFEGDNLSINELRYIISVMMMDGVLENKGKFMYKDILDRANGIKYNKESNEAMFYKAHLFETTRYLTDFTRNANEFFRNLDSGRLNDFTEKVKVAGINLTSGDDKAFARGVLSNWAVPYAIQMYFCAKASGKRMEAEKDSFGDVQQYPMFNGYKTFNCRICNIEEKTSKSGSHYLAVQAITDENGTKYGLMWFLWHMEDGLYVGKEVTVSGIYSKYTSRGSMFATLDKVQMSDAAEQNTEAPQRNKIDVGERLRGEKVTVSKVYEKSIVVTTSGGFDFLIYTKDFNTGAPKFPINFQEGMTLTVDGTMQISGNGKPYLNRCKIAV